MSTDNSRPEPPTARRTAAGFTTPRVTGVPSAWPAAYAGQTYYGLPPIKHSHYKWRTAVAFFCNGLAGGSQILGSLADLLGDARNRPLVRAGRYLALAGGSISTVTLISALHTRKRWYNMLRMLKRTSPMSIGIWSITPFTIASGLSAAGQFLEDRGFEKSGRRLARAFGLPAAALGGMVMSYMGTELEETNMPLWAGAYPALAPLYAAAGMSNSAAALLLLTESNRAPAPVTRGLKKVAFVSGAAELALGGVLHAAWRRSPETRAYARSAYHTAGRVLDSAWLGSLALRWRDGFHGGGNPHLRSGAAASVATLAGGLLMQFLYVYGGRKSGKHAADYFEYTRAEKRDRPERPSITRAARRRSATAAPVEARDSGPSSSGRRPAMNAGLRWGLIGIGAVLLLTTIPKRSGGAHANRND